MPPNTRPTADHHAFIHGISGIDPNEFDDGPATYPGPLPATESDLFFDYNDDHLTPGDERSLITYADRWKNAVQSVQVTLAGYASIEGQEKYNDKLSDRRAQSAKAYLVSLGVLPQAIITTHEGASVKFSASDLRQNRRVTIDPPIARPPGPEPSTACQVPPDDDPPSGGKPTLGPKLRTAAFCVKHPDISSQIGEVEHGSTNITTDAARFSAGLHLQENNEHEGSEVNAMRHVLWQATIASKFGPDIARDVGAVHEDDPSAVDGVTDTTGMVFKTLADADQSVDLLNNKLGRKIAADNKGLEMRDLAFKVMDEFHTNGLWTATKNPDGTYKISRTQVSNEEYDAAIAKLKTLNADGFDPQEAAAREAAAKRALEEQQRRERMGPKL